MAFSVEMPELGESVTEGTITQWLKAVGDTVEVDEPLLEVSTDKVDTEIPSPASGVLLEIHAEEDDTVDVGDIIAVIGEEGESSTDAPDAEDDSTEEDSEPNDLPEEEVTDDDEEDADEDETAEEPEESETVSEDSSSPSGETIDVEMPELGESVTEGTITQWLKAVGDTVEVDEALLEVSTDKVDTEIPSPAAGTLLEILAEEDDTIEVGDVIARIGSADGAPTDKASDDKTADSEDTEATPAEEEDSTAPEDSGKPEEPATEDESDADEQSTSENSEEEDRGSEPEELHSKVDTGEGQLPYVTPLVRKLAKKHGVDLSTIKGSGVGGRIRKQDVLKAAQETSSVPASSDKGQLSRAQQLSAQAIRSALHNTAQQPLIQEIDLTEIAQLFTESAADFVAQHGEDVSYLSVSIKALAEALADQPTVNVFYDAEAEELTSYDNLNVAITVDTPEGLLAPVIPAAQKLSVSEIAEAITDLTERATKGALKPKDLMDATFTVSNVGATGVLVDAPVLLEPQAGALGIGAVTKRPRVVVQDEVDAIAVRSVALISFTYDHQAVSTADAGRFIAAFKSRLEDADFAADLKA